MKIPHCEENGVVDLKTCEICGFKLRVGSKAYVYNGKVYCEMDFKRKFAPRCEECSDFILGKCVEVFGQKWHPEHLFCNRCSRHLERGDRIYNHMENLLCKVCIDAIYCKKCFACGKPISKDENGLRALGKDWHIACFVCSVCFEEFNDKSSFICQNSDPVCYKCTEKEFSI